MILGQGTNRLFVPIIGKTGDDTYQVPRVDPSTHAIDTITHTHHEAHAGSYYRSGMNFTLANGDVCTFGMVTPNIREIHVTWELNASADGTFTVLEDVTSFSGGASVIPLNHNRNSSKPSVAVCTRGMTGSDLITPTGGTTILNAVLSTGKGDAVARDAGAEFILKCNSKYLFRYTNGTSANIIQLAFEWYEHAPREA